MRPPGSPPVALHTALQRGNYELTAAATGDRLKVLKAADIKTRELFFTNTRTQTHTSFVPMTLNTADVNLSKIT